MNSLIKQPKNPLSRFWSWIKFKLFNKNNEQFKDSSTSNNLDNNTNINSIRLQEKDYLYKQDLDYETEKKHTINLYNDVMNNKVKLEDLDFADIVKIKLMLDSNK